MLTTIYLPDKLHLCTPNASDRAFFQQLFVSTREHLYQLPLPQLQIDRLAEQQYQLQQAHYARQWPNASTLAIYRLERAIGKVTFDVGDSGLHVIDIAIEPSMRGKGYGTTILGALQAIAAKRNLSVSLSVDRHNTRARKLYCALGFQMSDTSETHESLVWSHSCPRRRVNLPAQVLEFEAPMEAKVWAG